MIVYLLSFVETPRKLIIDHRIKWNEASILATESHKFSRKMRESIEIEKHSTIDQEGKSLDSTWRALFTVYLIVCLVTFFPIIRKHSPYVTNCSRCPH